MESKKLIIKPKEATGATTVVSSRLSVEMVKKLDEIAERTGRTRNEIVQLCLDFAINNLEIK